MGSSECGTATMLMLEPANNYAAEVVTFGGFSERRAQCKCNIASNKYSHRIKLDKKTIDVNKLSWTREAMPYGRNLNDVVLLPNGQLIILNGAKFGVIDNLRDPARDAWLYNPKAKAGKRFRTLAASSINRYYHSTALLLPDASIMVAGNEYGSCVADCAAKTPWKFEHRAERYLPPYFFANGRPRVTSASMTEAKYNAVVTLRYTGRATGATLMTPAAVTHQVNMNQRAVKLQVVSNSGGRMSVRMPPNSYITQPGWHMLFLMNGDAPAVEAQWLQLKL